MSAERSHVAGLEVGVVLLDIFLAHLSYQYYESWFLKKKTRLSPQQ